MQLTAHNNIYLNSSIGISDKESHLILYPMNGSIIDNGNYLSSASIDASGLPIVDANKAGVDPRVAASVNKMLHSVANDMRRTGRHMGIADNVMEKTSDTVSEALRSNEQLQRYIDLYDHYVKEKMFLAGAIMG